MSRTESGASGLPFRSRLLRLIVPVTVATIGVLCTVVWLAAYAGYAAQAQAVLDAELRDVAFAVSIGGTLEADRYRWGEPHHVSGERRLDPMFLQVFDSTGQMVRESFNIESLPDYPQEWLGEDVLDRPAVPRVRERTTSGQAVYVSGMAIRSPEGDMLGFAQAGRFVPSERALLDRLAIILAVVFVIFAGLLVGLVLWSTGRFVRPLEEITRFADRLRPGTLDERLPPPNTADRETVVLSRTLNGLLDRVEAGMNDMREFTANAAHELRTPLTALLGHVEVSLRRERPASAYRETLEFVRDKLETQLSTVSSLLLLARLDRTQQLTEVEPISLVVFCQEAVENLESMAEGRVQVEAGDGVDYAIEGQPDLIMRALANVLENALRYGGSSAVSIQLEEFPRAFQVTVRDRGPGIPTEELAGILGRFARGSGAPGHHPQGAGLGLAIAHRILKIHGGDLSVESGSDGTAVRMRFPRFWT
ncbi:MAG: hypothetical protein HKN29_02635 [Rhodothermales bacterium]|nr:hypothetical protein [Rhodothermales bacterium]